ncbi:MAG: DNA primase [Caulobacterales bacterium]
MRFSDAFLRQVRDRVSIAEYAGRKLSWDQRKTRPAAGDYWACCPFHQEKSSSFHVLDGKGIFNCFGCGEKGDIFGLSMKLEGLNFPEAVAMLAERAGLPLPVDDMESREQADARRGLYGIMEKAAKFYANALRGPDGKAARQYLLGRGLDEDVWARFGIGYAPAGWTSAIDALSAQGAKMPDLIAAGIAKGSDDGRRPIDVFRDRITFEIADAGGKVIAFGGRALDPQAPAKYINSPDTPLFHKGRTLYRLKQAREILARSKAEGLVVGEGYLDVIAFERAGIAAVAPLGTALTEEQLGLIWRTGAAPVLCFDGDGAGIKAAARALDLALPHLGPGKTVRIAVLPEGEDPDDVYRRAGPEALAPMIAAAQPAFDALFEREERRAALTTPEAKAAFKDRLKQAAFRIQDDETKRQYLRDLMARADALLRPAPRPFEPRRGGGKFSPGPAPITSELKAKTAISRARLGAEDFLRAAIDHPGFLEEFAEWIDRMSLTDPDLKAVRAAIQALTRADAELGIVDREAVSLHLETLGEERALARISRWPKSTIPSGDEAEAQWLARMALEVILPSIQEEMAAIRPRAESGESAAMELFQALGREARALKAQALDAGAEPDAA